METRIALYLANAHADAQVLARQFPLLHTYLAESGVQITSRPWNGLLDNLPQGETAEPALVQVPRNLIYDKWRQFVIECGRQGGHLCFRERSIVLPTGMVFLEHEVHRAAQAFLNRHEEWRALKQAA